MVLRAFSDFILIIYYNRFSGPLLGIHWRWVFFSTLVIAITRTTQNILNTFLTIFQQYNQTMLAFSGKIIKFLFPTHLSKEW